MAHAIRPNTEEHLLAELIAIAAARLAEKPLERCPAVMAHEVPCGELPGMLDEPEHDRVVYWEPPLDPLLQHKHQGADQPLELPRS
eukprot:1523852-Alexandrium_andersonii.AAC.1